MAQPRPGLIRRDRLAREIEEEHLAPAAARSAGSRGRLLPEAPDEFRTPFERDRDRIVHSKAFRRLKHKTQVFIHPEGDHYVTRLTHTLQVAQIARAKTLSGWKTRCQMTCQSTATISWCIRLRDLPRSALLLHREG